MALFSRARDPVRTTPNLDRKASLAFRWTLLRLALILGVPLAALVHYGQPALRMQYWYVGDHHPVFTRCQYLTLFDGWRDIRPPIGINTCPLIGFFPFDLSQLTGGRT